jgi:hypothetical protein
VFFFFSLDDLLDVIALPPRPRAKLSHASASAQTRKSYHDTTTVRQGFFFHSYKKEANQFLDLVIYRNLCVSQNKDLMTR